MIGHGYTVPGFQFAWATKLCIVVGNTYWSSVQKWHVTLLAFRILR